MRPFMARRNRRKTNTVTVLRHARCGHIDGIYSTADESEKVRAFAVLAVARRAGGGWEMTDIPLTEAVDGLLAGRGGCTECGIAYEVVR